MIKQLLNSVIAKYRDLSVASRSIIFVAQTRPIIVNFFFNDTKERLLFVRTDRPHHSHRSRQADQSNPK